MSCRMTHEYELAVLTEYLYTAYYGYSPFLRRNELQEILEPLSNGEYHEITKEAIFRELYNSNALAYAIRYGTKPDKWPEDLIPPCAVIDLRDEDQNTWEPHLYELCRFYVYQTMEGEEPESTIAYRAVEKLKEIMSFCIAERAADSVGADWGEWRYTKPN